jgi:hypothetical protein
MARCSSIFSRARREYLVAPVWRPDTRTGRPLFSHVEGWISGYVLGADPDAYFSGSCSCFELRHRQQLRPFSSTHSHCTTKPLLLRFVTRHSLATPVEYILSESSAFSSLWICLACPSLVGLLGSVVAYDCFKCWRPALRVSQVGKFESWARTTSC